VKARGATRPSRFGRVTRATARDPWSNPMAWPAPTSGSVASRRGADVDGGRLASCECGGRCGASAPRRCSRARPHRAVSSFYSPIEKRRTQPFPWVKSNPPPRRWRFPRRRPLPLPDPKPPHPTPPAHPPGLVTRFIMLLRSVRGCWCLLRLRGTTVVDSRPPAPELAPTRRKTLPRPRPGAAAVAATSLAP